MASSLAAVHDPGIELRWGGEQAAVVPPSPGKDDADVFRDLVQRTLPASGG